jgi:general secretion pathway protein E
MMGLPENDAVTLYHPGSCEHCNHLGYRGRTGIYELVLIDENMRQLIHDQAGELELTRHARSLTPSIREDGWRKVLAGQTSVEEVLRVTRED